MPVRFAVAADLPAMTRLFDPHIDLINRNHGGYNKAKAERYILEIIEAHLAGVAEDDGEIIGTIGLAPYQQWHGDQVMLANRWLYTVPGHRSFAAWRSLVAFARSMAEEAGLALTLSFEDFTDADRKHRLFGRAGRQLLDAWGFVPAGGKYLIAEPTP